MIFGPSRPRGRVTRARGFLMAPDENLRRLHQRYRWEAASRPLGAILIWVSLDVEIHQQPPFPTGGFILVQPSNTDRLDVSQQY